MMYVSALSSVNLASVNLARLLLGMGDQLVGQDQLGAGDDAERQSDLAGLGHQAHRVAVAPEQLALEALAGVERLVELDARVEPGKAVVILRPDQRPVDPG